MTCEDHSQTWSTTNYGKRPRFQSDVDDDLESRSSSTSNCWKRRRNNSEYTCAECLQRFTRADTLSRHASETEHLAYRCNAPDCDKSFSSRTALSRHARIHLAAENHSCCWCHKPFNRKDNWIRHQALCSKSISKGSEKNERTATPGNTRLDQFLQDIDIALRQSRMRLQSATAELTRANQELFLTLDKQQKLLDANQRLLSTNLQEGTGPAPLRLNHELDKRSSIDHIASEFDFFSKEQPLGQSLTSHCSDVLLVPASKGPSDSDCFLPFYETVPRTFHADITPFTFEHNPEGALSLPSVQSSTGGTFGNEFWLFGSDAGSHCASASENTARPSTISTENTIKTPSFEIADWANPIMRESERRKKAQLPTPASSSIGDNEGRCSSIQDVFEDSSSVRLLSPSTSRDPSESPESIRNNLYFEAAWEVPL